VRLDEGGGNVFRALSRSLRQLLFLREDPMYRPFLPPHLLQYI